MDQVTKEDIAQRVKPQEEIPVVNEEEVSEVKPEVQLPKDKKETVAVVQTGRGDPFLPLSKYTTLKVEKPKTTYVAPKKVDENIYLYGDVPIEKPSTRVYSQTTSLPIKAVKNMHKYILTGTMINQNKKSAVLEVGEQSYFVKIGDIIDGSKVVDIRKDAIVLVNGNQKFEFYRKVERPSMNQLNGDLNYGRNDRIYSNVIDHANENEDVNRFVSDEEIEVNKRD